MGSEVTNDKKKKGEITDVISKWIPLLTGIITLIVAAGNIILNFFNYGYAGKAEEFYEIPSRYFVNSIIDNRIMIFVYIVAYFMTLGSPLIIKKLFKVNRFGFFMSFICSLCITLLTSTIVILSIIKIIVFLNLKVSENLVLIATGVIAALTCILYITLFLTDFTRIRESERKQDRLYKIVVLLIGLFKINMALLLKLRTQNIVLLLRLHTKIVDYLLELLSRVEAFFAESPRKSEICVKELCAKIETIFKKFFYIISIIVIMILISSIFILASDRIVETPKNKTQYEIATINSGDKGNEQYMAIVSYKNSKAILMDCTIITQAAINGKEIEILQLIKGKYRLSDIEGYQIEYREFNAVKCE